ncbi:MAG: M15 family metallopeptidase [Angelakisella sp.]|nr:M15 family metallopeptidase [Angelakisella sp.]
MSNRFSFCRTAVLALALCLLAGCGDNSNTDIVSGHQPISSSLPHSASSSASESSSQPQSQSSSPQSESSSSPASSQPTGGGDVIDETDWRLKLVNPTHAITESQLPTEFEEVGGYKFDARVAPAVRELLAAAKEDGIGLTIISGYRTIERSRTLYNNKVQAYLNAGYSQANAEKEAAKWVAPPGTSEHHTGLAMDVISVGYYNKFSDLVEEFAYEPEAIWLKENCARFGFILRFPASKEDITGIHFEPWHFRYVGKEAAAEIMEKGICLEEYLGKA